MSVSAEGLLSVHRGLTRTAPDDHPVTASRLAQILRNSHSGRAFQARSCTRRKYGGGEGVASICIVTINEQEANAVDHWLNTATDRYTRHQFTHWNLRQQGNIGAGSILSALLADRQHSSNPFHLIIGFGCAGLPRLADVEGRKPKLGDAFIVTEAAYREVGQIFPYDHEHGQHSPNHAIEAAFLRVDKRPATADPYRTPFGAASLPFPISSTTLKPRRSGPIPFPSRPKQVNVFANSVAFSSDKVMTVDASAQPAPRMTVNGKNVHSYGEALHDCIIEAQARKPSLPLVVEMEAYGIFMATRRWSGQSFLIRVATDECAGKEALSLDNLSSHQVQEAYLHNATGAIDHLLKQLTSRKMSTVAVHFARRFVASVGSTIRVDRARQGDVPFQLHQARIAGFQIAWELFEADLATAAQAFCLMYDKSDDALSDKRTSRERRRDFRRLLSVLSHLEIELERFDAELDASLTSDDVGDGFVGRIQGRLFEQYRQTIRTRRSLRTVFDVLQIDEALVHAVFEPPWDLMYVESSSELDTERVQTAARARVQQALAYIRQFEGNRGTDNAE
jgi:hypothetical protein